MWNGDVVAVSDALAFLTDPSFIIGSFSAPRQGDEDTVIWSFSIPD